MEDAEELLIVGEEILDNFSSQITNERLDAVKIRVESAIAKQKLIEEQIKDELEGNDLRYCLV